MKGKYFFFAGFILDSISIPSEEARLLAILLGGAGEVRKDEVDRDDVGEGDLDRDAEAVLCVGGGVDGDVDATDRGDEEAGEDRGVDDVRDRGGDGGGVGPVVDGEDGLDEDEDEDEDEEAGGLGVWKSASESVEEEEVSEGEDEEDMVVVDCNKFVYFF